MVKVRKTFDFSDNFLTSQSRKAPFLTFHLYFFLGNQLTYLVFIRVLKSRKSNKNYYMKRLNVLWMNIPRGTKLLTSHKPFMEGTSIISKGEMPLVNKLTCFSFGRNQICDIAFIYKNIEFLCAHLVRNKVMLFENIVWRIF